MKLHMTTDYGIRVMCCLYNKDTLITANELSEQLYISYGYLNKVLGCLRQAGMVEVLHGRFGGYQIADSAREATLYDIIQVMEGDIQINSCFGEDGFCNREAMETCLVRAALESAQNELVDNLRRVRLSDISGMAGRLHGNKDIHTDLQCSMSESD
ncbi:RrF2 family transcriptional regulator [Lacrimispora brassicae]